MHHHLWVKTSTYQGVDELWAEVQGPANEWRATATATGFIDAADDFTTAADAFIVHARRLQADTAADASSSAGTFEGSADFIQRSSIAFHLYATPA